MQTRSFLPCLLGPSLLLAACEEAPPVARAQPALVATGGTFAAQTCGKCHAIAGDGLSPHSGAPPFKAIVNQQGLTGETLSAFLREAHNYPQEMDFYLTQDQVNALVAYMLTLRDPNYVRPAD